MSVWSWSFRTILYKQGSLLLADWSSFCISAEETCMMLCTILYWHNKIPWGEVFKEERFIWPPVLEVRGHSTEVIIQWRNRKRKGSGGIKHGASQHHSNSLWWELTCAVSQVCPCGLTIFRLSRLPSFTMSTCTIRWAFVGPTQTTSKSLPQQLADF